MRYIFVDEAGTSAKEPVTIVVGIIVEADKHVMLAENLVNEILGAVPAALKSDFVFHAKQIYGDSKYQEVGWALTDRLNLLHAMMSVPRKIGMAITVAAHWRDAEKHYQELGLTGPQSDHMHAFTSCLTVSDRNIRKHARANEIAAVVAEDLPEMRKFFKKIPKICRDNPIYFSKEYLRETISDREAGFITQNGDHRITRIRNSVHFVEKSEDLLVQVADACAYGFRRYFAQEKFGADFVISILGDKELLRNFASPGGCQCYWPPNN